VGAGRISEWQFLADDWPQRAVLKAGKNPWLGLLAASIDAREFNPAFPATFPRFVQSAIWRYCAEKGLDVCNGNRIDDDTRCDNGHCQLFRRCDRIALRSQRALNQ
jgi:hypothetical protein